MNYQDYWPDRGFPWEHDPGPPKNLSWSRIFSETPNYRALGASFFSREKFRWHFGPMYYRGRLKKNKVKVLVIGQEGAQDESLSHRSFTGGTGGRMQYFLKFIGINHNYLFLNTFVYPIFGQYNSPEIRWLAQHPDSPIAQQRYEIFDYVLRKNDVQLIVAVGNAAKETVHDWILSRGGQCPDGVSDLSTATANFLDPNTKVVGVHHPGGAARGGQLTLIKQSFQDAVDHIENWINLDPNWLQVDAGAQRNFAGGYTYSKAPIPFKDLPLGTCWRLGRKSTSSNRKDNQRSIQIFSKDGSYRSPSTLQYDGLSFGSQDGYSQGPNDFPYEPPVDDYKDYDKGPTKSFAKLIMGGKNGYHWPDFSALGVTSNHSFGYTCSYRGRPNKSTFLILADQQSQDDLFTMRALTGNSGQKMQAFLNAAGISKNYCILRSLPVDTLDLTFNERKQIVDDPQVQKVLKEIVKKIFRYNKVKVVLCFGSLAKYIWEAININTAKPVIFLKSWRQNGASTDWQEKLQIIRTKTYAKDIPPTWNYNGERIQIPRYDLPYGVLRWQGSSGDRSQRAKEGDGSWSENYYKWFVPDWVYDLPPGS